MSARADLLDSTFAATRIHARTSARAPARIALLGTGTVGGAVLERLDSWTGTPLGPRLQLVHVANSRFAISDADGLCPRETAQTIAAARHDAAIPSSLLPIIFEPFRSGGQNRSGLGLGLYIVREIVAAHGGSIRVTSTQAEGTTFRVELPA